MDKNPNDTKHFQIGGIKIINLSEKDIYELAERVTDALQANGVYVCEKENSWKIPTVPNHKSDLLIFVAKQKLVCKIIELKGGDTFDTQKASSEKEQLEEFSIKFGAKIPFVTEYYICCFNQEDKNTIMTGFKGAFSIEHIMTGKELCSLLNINHSEIINERKADAEDNFAYFISELLNMPDVKNEILRQLDKTDT